MERNWSMHWSDLSSRERDTITLMLRSTIGGLASFSLALIIGFALLASPLNAAVNTGTAIGIGAGSFTAGMAVGGMSKGGAGAGGGTQSLQQMAVQNGMSAADAGKLNWADAKIADEACLPIMDKRCPCGPAWDEQKKACASKIKSYYLCPCKDPRGPVNGLCMEVKVCKGMSFTNEKGQGGQGTGMDQVM